MNQPSMNNRLRFFFYTILIFLFVACKSEKKVSMSGEDTVEVNDFIEFFPESSFPYQFADTSLSKKDNDSLLISHTIFTQFVPDSFLTRVFGTKEKPKLYPMARLKGDETYLFTKAVAGSKRTAFVLAFDKNKNFITAMPVLQPDQLVATQQSVVIDRRYNLYKNISKKNTDGTVSEGKDVFILNNESKSFMLIMTDPLEDKVAELINPIDSMSRKQKYTADYGSGKTSLVSIRDGRKKGMVTFFIHFEKDKGKCTGELKGDARMISNTVAEYREAGEPCSLQFTFTSSSVTIKELGGCGSRRGLRCSFDGVYPRKKEAKSTTTKKSAK